jgi:hypothetical protein
VWEVSETRYARSGEVFIAYRVIGDGPVDVVNIPPFVSNVELMTDHPRNRGYRDPLTEFCRLIVLNKRGTGVSDRVRDVPTLETRMDDVRGGHPITRGGRRPRRCATRSSSTTSSGGRTSTSGVCSP